MKNRNNLHNWRHLLGLGLTIALISGVLVFVFLHFDFVPHADSQERVYMDGFFKILLAIAAVIFTVIVGIIGYSLIFFRKKAGDETEGPPIKGSARLERAWTIIPLIIVIGLAVYGAVVLDKMTAAGPPQTEMEIDVVAFRFGWQFIYPQYNVTSYELYTPVNQRILIKLQSKDVVHSFWVQQWGPKQDAVPGITTQVRYTPTVIGQYTVQCSQLCGYGHTYMTAPVYVTSTTDFLNWVKQQQTTTTPTTTATTATTAVTTSATGTTTTATTPASNAVTINLTAQNIAFNMSTITVPAGAAVTVNFQNMDNQTPHNFSVYTSGSATGTAAGPIFTGQIVTGVSSTTYKFTAPTTPGTYFFRCDVHPTMMTGTFVVK
jgi:cytochrome c oxidase subunit 2